ncbi:MAG: c-type cytochrome domain-containing protein, partial [Phycisphaerales bacterium]
MVAAWALTAAIAGVPGDVALPEGLGALLDAQCIDCHGGITTKGGLDLRPARADGRASEDVLRAVRRRLARRDMPPEDEPERPSDEEYAAAVASIDRTVPPAWKEVPTVRRLNRAQWLGAVRDRRQHRRGHRHVLGRRAAAIDL